MKKPSSLRQWLLNSVACLKRNPETLQVHITGGHLGCRLEAGYTHRNNYTLQLYLLEMTGSTDQVIIPLLAWLRENQTDFKPDSLKYEAELLSNTTFDLSITLPLSENCIVTLNDQGEWSTQYQDEPTFPHLQEAPPPLQSVEIP